MSPKRNLRSICAQYRNASSSRSSKVSKEAKYLLQGTGGTLGLISGYYMYGGALEGYEEQRQQIVRKYFGRHAVVNDMREDMWPGFKKPAADLKKMMEMMESMWEGGKSLLRSLGKKDVP